MTKKRIENDELDCWNEHNEDKEEEEEVTRMITVRPDLDSAVVPKPSELVVMISIQKCF